MQNPLKPLKRSFFAIKLYFSKVLHLRSFTKFWIRNLSVSTHSLTFRVTSLYVLHDTYSGPCLLLKIQIYSYIFSHIVAYLEPCVILAYSECFHIQNPGIFRTQYIFRTLSRHILAYSVGCVTLIFWKTFFIQNFAIFRISALRNLRHIQNPVYLGTFRHSQTYSIMITLTFFSSFFHFFQQDKRRHIYNFWL